MQDGHQATMKVFDKAEAKVFKPTVDQSIGRWPVATDVSPRISLIHQPLGPQLNKEVGRKAQCLNKKAAMTQRFPKSILKQGCQRQKSLNSVSIGTSLNSVSETEVRTTLDTGCSPNNYLSMLRHSVLSCYPAFQSESTFTAPTHHSTSCVWYTTRRWPRVHTPHKA
jgi:hypothetical protein